MSPDKLGMMVLASLSFSRCVGLGLESCGLGLEPYGLGLERFGLDNNTATDVSSWDPV